MFPKTNAHQEADSEMGSTNRNMELARPEAPPLFFIWIPIAASISAFGKPHGTGAKLDTGKSR
jgi:hypothetical protein